MFASVWIVWFLNYLNNLSNSSASFESKNSRPTGQDIIKHNYSQEQLSAVYDSLDDIEI